MLQLGNGEYVCCDACLQLLDLCAVYGGHVFRLEMATRDFAAECRTLISNGKVRGSFVGNLQQFIRKLQLLAALLQIFLNM